MSPPALHSTLPSAHHLMSASGRPTSSMRCLPDPMATPEPGALSPPLCPHTAFGLAWKPVMCRPSSRFDLCLFSDSSFSHLPRETKNSTRGETVHHSPCGPSHTQNITSAQGGGGDSMFVALNVMQGISTCGAALPRSSTREVPRGPRSLGNKVCPVPSGRVPMDIR